MPRVFIADDDNLLSQMVADQLGAKGFSVDVVSDGETAAEYIRTQSFDLLILDWNMPGMTGVDVCKLYRRLGQSGPVLMLTSRSDIEDKETGLDSGADDYLTKPFEMRELLARVNSLLRRPANYVQKVEKLGHIEIDLEGRTLKRGNSIFRLQPREMALLEFFLRRQGHLLPTNAILSGVWGADFEGSEVALRACLTKLRKVLASLEYENAIETVHGFGYRLKVFENEND